MARNRTVLPRVRGRRPRNLGEPRRLAVIEPVGIVRQANGIWRMVFRRDGLAYWSSLNTRNEKNALRKWEKWKKSIEDLESGH